MKYSLGISNFLEELSSLSHYIGFLYFFSMITEEGFLISPCFLWNSAFKWVYLFFSPLTFTSFFSAIFKVFSDNYFVFLHFFFLKMVLITASCTMSRTSVHRSSAILSHVVLYFSLPLYNHKEFDLGHT